METRKKKRSFTINVENISWQQYSVEMYAFCIIYVQVHFNNFSHFTLRCGGKKANHFCQRKYLIWLSKRHGTFWNKTKRENQQRWKRLWQQQKKTIKSTNRTNRIIYQIDSILTLSGKGFEFAELKVFSFSFASNSLN